MLFDCENMYVHNSPAGYIAPSVICLTDWSSRVQAVSGINCSDYEWNA